MQYIDEVDLSNKKVILRCDFNVPIKDGIVSDDTRIKKSLKTINYLLEKNCSLILMSHFGRVKNREDKIKNSLKPVADKLTELLNKSIKFIQNPVGMDVIETCSKLQAGEVCLLENTRYCDYPEKLETGNDEGLSKYWSSLGEVFVLDAFGSMHRAHASVAGIAKYIPCYLGLLVKEELGGLDKVVNNIEHPFGVFMGGAKVDDKLQYIKDILPKCDYLCVGGGIANSFLLALGYDVKNSLVTSDKAILDEVATLYDNNKEKILLPVDFEFDNTKISDLGEKSINKYLKRLQICKTIFINGSCGIFEDERFAKGTISLVEGLKEADAYKVAGGGDTLNAINQYKLNDYFDYLSSGGGAALEYISKGSLESLEFISKYSTK